MKIPGHAPEVTPLRQENAPTCVKLEYDSSSGRYREYGTPGDFMGWTAATVLFTMDYLYGKL